jgi:hypothetical protein
MLKDLANKIIIPFTILLEAYRVFNGTLLVIFVPGVCGDKACLPQQNFINGSTIYRINCGVNLVALLAFIALYSVEVRREYKLMAYLRVNPEKPSDALTTKGAFESLPVDKKEIIHSYDLQYKRIVGITVLIFVINTLLSGYVIITEYGNDKGPILFATGTVLIASKIYHILTTNSNDGYISAYTQTRTQFNDVQERPLTPV